jgi:hypothetical protein
LILDQISMFTLAAESRYALTRPGAAAMLGG